MFYTILITFDKLYIIHVHVFKVVSIKICWRSLNIGKCQSLSASSNACVACDQTTETFNCNGFNCLGN